MDMEEEIETLKKILRWEQEKDIRYNIGLLEEDWDSYGAKATYQDCIDVALKVLDCFYKNDILVYALCPIPTGGIEFCLNAADTCMVDVEKQNGETVVEGFFMKDDAEFTMVDSFKINIETDIQKIKDALDNVGPTNAPRLSKEERSRNENKN